MPHLQGQKATLCRKIIQKGKFVLLQGVSETRKTTFDDTSLFMRNVTSHTKESVSSGWLIRLFWFLILLHDWIVPLYNGLNVITVEGDSRPRVVRSCGWILDESVNKACVKRSGTFSVLMEYCSCDQDGCNAAFSSLTANNSFSLVVKMFLSFIVSLYCLQRRQVSSSLL